MPYVDVRQIFDLAMCAREASHQELDEIEEQLRWELDKGQSMEVAMVAPLALALTLCSRRRLELL